MQLAVTKKDIDDIQIQEYSHEGSGNNGLQKLFVHIYIYMHMRFTP